MMSVPISWLALAGLWLGVAVLAWLARRDAKLAGQRQVRLEVAEAGERAQRQAMEAEARARAEFEAQRAKVEAGDLNAPFHVKAHDGNRTT